ncbi:MAG: hypothetical protein ABEL51_09140 [Salinibacter sp.]
MTSSPDTSSPRTRRLHRLLYERAVAVLRADDSEVLPSIAEALLAGGISAIEVNFSRGLPGRARPTSRTCPPFRAPSRRPSSRRPTRPARMW